MIVTVQKPLPETPREIELEMTKQAWGYINRKGKIEDSIERMVVVLRLLVPRNRIEWLYCVPKDYDQMKVGFEFFVSRTGNNYLLFIDIFSKYLSLIEINYSVEDKGNAFEFTLANAP